MKLFELYEELNECPILDISDEVRNEVKKYDSDEHLLRSGGLPIDMLDRLAHGFSEDDIKTLEPKQLKIKWKDDIANVKYQVEKFIKQHSDVSFKKAMVMWAKQINLEEPIDVSYEKDKFYIEDGHHRYYAAKILNKPLNVNLEIKMNPMKKIAPSLSYDDFHRCIWKQVNSEKNFPEKF